MRRSRRVGRERLFYSAAYRCEKCPYRSRVSRLEDMRNLRHAGCPNCGQHDLTVLSKRDRVDRWNRNPLRLVQRLFGARLYHCWLCRLQFYDLRGRLPALKKKNVDGDVNHVEA